MDSSEVIYYLGSERASAIKGALLPLKGLVQISRAGISDTGQARHLLVVAEKASTVASAGQNERISNRGVNYT